MTAGRKTTRHKKSKRGGNYKTVQVLADRGILKQILLCTYRHRQGQSDIEGAQTNI